MNREPVIWAEVRTSHRDDDFSSGVTFFQMPDSRGDVAQWIGLGV